MMLMVSITLPQLLLYVALAAVVLTVLVGIVMKGHKSWIMTYLQNFCGALFIFSGWVKAADPLGTAYKMEQYFGEFHATFEPTWFGFIAPIFPLMSEYSIGFSVFMIVLEIVLGLMLIIGAKPKLSAWLFLGIVLFFTALTGFTYLTGYVGDGGSFFNFSSWGPYKESNMKVTDCGCFGDFIKLEPKTSFLKDVALLFPAFFFFFRHRDMHELFTPKVRNIVLGVVTAGLLWYCMSNYVWNIPGMDFRPFKNGVDVAAQKEKEQAAAASVEVVEWKLKNENTGEQKTLDTKTYFAELSTYSKANGWRVQEQIMTEPAIQSSKISEFSVEDFNGDDVSYHYLDNENYHFMIVSHKVKAKVESTGDGYAYKWGAGFMDDYKTIIKPLAEKIKSDGHEVSIVTGGADETMIEDLKSKLGIDADYYTADDILLKTIVRSNPGVVLWKDGKIVQKWHKKQLPTYDQIKAKYIK